MNVSTMAPKLAIKLGFSLIWNGVLAVVTRGGELYIGFDTKENQ